MTQFIFSESRASGISSMRANPLELELEALFVITVVLVRGWILTVLREILSRLCKYFNCSFSESFAISGFCTSVCSAL